MNDVEFAVVKLTEPHTVWVDGQQATSDPLLTMLWEARYPSLGKGASIGGGEGSMLNQKALAAYEHIDGIVRAWLNHFRERHKGDLIPLVQHLYEVLKAEDAGGRLEDRERMFGMFQQFVAQIENCLDPPAEKELIGACPECEATHAVAENGDRLRAVRVAVKPGRALIAECHACTKIWVGHDALMGLAEHFGADVDWVALRDLTNTKETTAV